MADATSVDYDAFTAFVSAMSNAAQAFVEGSKPAGETVMVQGFFSGITSDFTEANSLFLGLGEAGSQLNKMVMDSLEQARVLGLDAAQVLQKYRNEDLNAQVAAIDAANGMSSAVEGL